MVDSDSDYTTDTDCNKKRPVDNDADTSAGESPRKSARLKGHVLLNDDKKNRASLPTNLQQLSQIKKHLSDQIRGRDIDENLSLRVLRAAVEMQDTHLRLKQKRGRIKANTVPPARIATTICKMFGIGNRTYSKIISSYFSDDRRKRVVYVSGKDGRGRSGNQNQKETRIMRTTECRLLVQQFVREKRANRDRVTARQVMDCLVERGFLTIQLDDQSGYYQEKAFAAAYRAVRRLLENFGYQRGKRSGNLVMKRQVVLQKHLYLNSFVANRNAPPENRLREVMVDESYIHEHYHRFDDSLWDPSDEQDVQLSKSPVKGRRYCFVAAIQGADPRVATAQGGQDNVELTALAGLVPGSVWAFCPQKQGDHHGDYHKVFNGENFVNWWTTQLLPNLHQPSLIILDNAKYHLVHDTGVPKIGKLKKAELQAYLAAKGVRIDPFSTSFQLREIARDWIKVHEKPAIVKLAEALGHKVLFTPPYHSDLQPIELLWALIKGNIGRKHNKDTSLELVHHRLMEEFGKLEERPGRISIQKMIDKCATLAMEMYHEIQTDDEEDEYGSDDESVECLQEEDGEDVADHDD